MIHDMDLDVRAGEVFALLGPNGAGKTTSVEIMEGVRQRSGGTVRVLDRDPGEDPPELRARIGVVPQSSGAYTDLTVREVVEHFAAFYPRPLPAGQVIDMVGLGAQQRKQAQTLSGGQLRRLDVAVGIVGDPDLIFLDEPTTGLDPDARRAAWELVRYFAARGTTTLLTTHYLDEVEALAQRAAILVGGRIVDAGPVSELGGRNKTPAAVSFAQESPLADRPLPRLPVDAVVDRPAAPGATLTVHTNQPTAALATLVPWAHGAGLRELPKLRINRPTLEETYLRLIHEQSAGMGAMKGAAA